MKSKNSLGDRMKRYEGVTDYTLTRNVPCIIRLDGKAFHTWTTGLTKPWCSDLETCMHYAAIKLCSSIDGARFALTQSDEITLLVVDYQAIKSEAWFDYRVQKMASVTASICTAAFNEIASKLMPQHLTKKGYALFDSRVYSVPDHEVTNVFLWRQQDATRNSIQMLGQSYFSHKQLQKLNSSQIQEKLWEEKNVNWNNLPVYRKRGCCFYKMEYEKNETNRHIWSIDLNPPIFTENRDYIENWVKSEPTYEKTEDNTKGTLTTLSGFMGY